MTGSMPDRIEALDDLNAVSAILTAMWSLDEDLGNIVGLSEALGFLSRTLDSRIEILNRYINNGVIENDELNEETEA